MEGFNFCRFGFFFVSIIAITQPRILVQADEQNHTVNDALSVNARPFIRASIESYTYSYNCNFSDTERVKEKQILDCMIPKVLHKILFVGSLTLDFISNATRICKVFNDAIECSNLTLRKLQLEECKDSNLPTSYLDSLLSHAQLIHNIGCNIDDDFFQTPDFEKLNFTSRMIPNCMLNSKDNKNVTQCLSSLISDSKNLERNETLKSSQSCSGIQRYHKCLLEVEKGNCEEKVMEAFQGKIRSLETWISESCNSTSPIHSLTSTGVPLAATNKTEPKTSGSYHSTTTFNSFLSATEVLILIVLMQIFK